MMSSKAPFSSRKLIHLPGKLEKSNSQRMAESSVAAVGESGVVTVPHQREGRGHVLATPARVRHLPVGHFLPASSQPSGCKLLAVIPRAATTTAVAAAAAAEAALRTT